jgi:hypothetical protein
MQGKSRFFEFATWQTSVTIVSPGVPVLIYCQHTGHTKTLLSLLHAEALNTPYINVTSQANIALSGQYFILNDVSLNDEGYYLCAGTDVDEKQQMVTKLVVLESK